MPDVKPPIDNEKRKTNRVFLQTVDNHAAWIIMKTGTVKVRVIDFSPFGVGVVVDGKEKHLPLSQGERVGLELQRDGQRIQVDAMLVTVGKTSILRKPFTRLGFRILSSYELQGRELDRDTRRFALKDVSNVVCQSDDPTRPGEKAIFGICDISRSGIMLQTSARNKFLLPGLKLSCLFSIPGKEDFMAELKILYIQSSANKYLLGCEYEEIGPQALAALGGLCLNFGQDVKSGVIHESGFPLGAFAPAPSLQGKEEEGVKEKEKEKEKEAANFQDFMQVPQLRLESEHGKGQSLEVHDPWQMIDKLDEEAQQIFVKLGTRVVASARLLPSSLDNRPLGLAADVRVPEEIWRDGLVVVNHIAIEPEFDRPKSYVLTRLWSYIFQAAFHSRQRWLLVEHLDTAASTFESLGFRPREAVKIEWPLEIKTRNQSGTNEREGVLGVQAKRQTNAEVTDEAGEKGEDKVATSLAHDKYSLLDLQGLYQGRDLPFAYWSLMIAPLCKVLAQEPKLTITKFLAIRLFLAIPVRQLMIWKLRRDEDWRLQELIERESRRLRNG